MKNLSTMSLSQLQDIKFILTDIDDTLTSDGRLKSDAYEAMERLSDNGYSVIPVTGRCAGCVITLLGCGQLKALLEKMEHSFLAMIMPIKK